MENPTIFLKQGNMIFASNQIEIDDKAKRNIVLSFFIILLTSFYAITSIISCEKTGDKFMFYSGIGLLILNGLGVIMVLFRKKIGYSLSYENNIAYQEINLVKMKRNELYQLKVEIRLNNKKKRRIFLKDDKTNLESFVNILNQYKIGTEIEPGTILK